VITSNSLSDIDRDAGDRLLVDVAENSRSLASSLVVFPLTLAAF
jgi:hypothetical protein